MSASKKCNVCFEVKELEYFSKNASKKDGKQYTCKVCVKEYNAAYKRSEEGVIATIMCHMKSSQAKRNHTKGPVDFTKPQLRVWLYANGFKVLYDAWVDSNYDKWLKPSCDRLKNEIGYSLDNLRLVTWEENDKAAKDDRRNGVSTSGKVCKAVVKCDANGEILESFVSGHEAKRSVGYRIDHNLYSGNPCRNGFYWRFK